ncbi:glycosyltransferase [Chitinophaga horti]|uniref:Glycosyltransferase n=1 Tax=Chitinophaga horti TaxID=2920382 RepID=A0ABY6J4S4_9BACT|nr:glycosyltransferase [Chitinophaga horti]UYQ94684.1 glycosyltransferase [Chitinophaga horti]
MKIAYIASYPPRECGIATFTNHLVQSMVACGSKEEKPEVAVIAINDSDQKYDYPSEVEHVIRQQHLEDYHEAARFINQSGADICIVQHEFGIFGGDNGVYLLPLLHALEIPFFVTFHTVLKEPSFIQKSIVREIAQRASRIVVMSQLAIDFLVNIYGVSSEKVQLIEHGVPDFSELTNPQQYLVSNTLKRKLIFTFGLLSRNKGIETVIQALPAVIEKHPDVLYIVAGATHPAVLRHAGDEYRDSLQKMVEDLQLENHVLFLNRFLSEKELFAYLTCCDIYVTPYLSEAQITSGTLTYALGAGSAVISTPYWYAKELLANDRGLLFDFKNSQQLAKCVNDLLDTPGKLRELKQNSATYGKKLQWSQMGARYRQLARKILATPRPTVVNTKPIPDITNISPLNLSHIRRLTDDTGIVQHAKYGIPNLKEGYCLDDNSRALMMMLMAQHYRRNKESLELITTYLSFIQYMQREDGNFRNFLSFSRQYLDEVGSEDSFGRTVWALGYLVRFAPNNSYREFAQELFHRSTQHFATMEHLRGRANAAIGVSHYLAYHPTDEGMFKLLDILIQPLLDSYDRNHTDDWRWFEYNMSYDNGILPLALLHAYEVTGDERTYRIAMESIEFLEQITMCDGYLTPVGNDGWHQPGKCSPKYDQQAIETMAMVLLYQQAYAVSNERDHLEKMYTAYRWFLGENSLRVPLYDSETHGCCDGLQQGSINRNQGAESTLAYLISHLSVLKEAEALRQEKPVQTTLITASVLSSKIS